MLGIGACVAVAWACAWTCDGWPAIDEEADATARHVNIFGRPRWVEVERDRRFGGQLRYIGRILTPSENVSSEHDDIFVAGVPCGGHKGTRIDTAYRIDRVSWSRLGGPQIDEFHRKVVEEEGAFGWPLSCLWGSYNTYFFCGNGCCQSRQERSEWMIPVSTASYGLVRGLPLRPMALGFVIDSAMHAGVCYGLLSLLSAMRVRARHRAGCCHRCGYDLRGAAHHACPECGLLTEK